MTTIDLHMHSTFSDGCLAPTKLMQLLARRNVDVAALTDHDSTSGLDEAFAEAATHHQLRLIPGIEISADHPYAANTDVHVLGYFIDYHDAQLQTELKHFREDRDLRGQRMVEKLSALGYPLAWDRVKEIAQEAGVGRPHIARAMLEKGYIAEIRDAFNGLLNDGGAAFVDRPHVSLQGAVDLIRRVGGVAVLAHPLYVADYEYLVPRLADIGFVGFEVHYAGFTIEQRTSLLALAHRYDMLPCGGSDYHATGSTGETLPGSSGPPLDVLQELEARAAPSTS